SNRTAFGSIDVNLHTPTAILLGTQDGLFRLRTGSNVLEADTSFSRSHITALQEDQEGFIWVGTANNGIVKLNNSFEPVLHLLDELKEKHINTLRVDNQNRLWIGFTVSGYMVYQNDKLYSPAQDMVKQGDIRTILS